MVFHTIMAFIVTGVLVNTNLHKDILHRQTESIMDVDRESYKMSEFFEQNLDSKMSPHIPILLILSPKKYQFLTLRSHFKKNNQIQCTMLTVPYYHVIFTLPHELRAFARRNQQKVYGLFIKSAAHSIIKLAADSRYVGGRVGMMAVLHTWGSNLTYHCHVHCLVTGGGMSLDGRTWMPAREDYLVPVRALSRLFRGNFLGRIRRQFEDVNLPKSIRQKDWVVHCKPAVQGSRTVLNYLARYIHRVAITNSRIISADNNKVTFRYKGSGGVQTRTMTVSAQEFIRRFLPHVLPAGTSTVSPSEAALIALWTSCCEQPEAETTLARA